MNETKEMILEDQLVGCYQVLFRRALQITEPDADIPKLHRDFSILIDRWVDDELKMLGELKNLSGPKRRALFEFEKLATSFNVKPTSNTENPGTCRICGSQLTHAYYADNLICVECATPVINALDDLVRASTKRYSPEELMSSWKELKEAFDHNK